MNRRQFLARSGALSGLGAVAYLLPGFLKARGWHDAAYTRSIDLVQDTIDGVVAFILPGDDPYSVLQGHTANGPGGVAGGAGKTLIANLDRYLPTPHVSLFGVDLGIPGVDTVPLSAAIANLLDVMALRLNPLAIAPLTPGGVSVSAFSHLWFAQKAQVFQELESLHLPDNELPEPFTQASGNVSFLFGILPAFTGFLVGNEAGAYEPATRSLTSRPVSWQISGYQPNGPVEGWNELKGYYRGRRKASP